VPAISGVVLFAGETGTMERPAGTAGAISSSVYVIPIVEQGDVPTMSVALAKNVVVELSGTFTATAYAPPVSAIPVPFGGPTQPPA
jgi:hypothetical protein